MQSFREPFVGLLSELVDFGPRDWRKSSLCSQVDGDLFFPERGASTRDAKRICAGCSVRQECLTFALEHNEQFGVWGGLSQHERQQLRRQSGRTRTGTGRNQASPTTRMPPPDVTDLLPIGRQVAGQLAEAGVRLSRARLVDGLRVVGLGVSRARVGALLQALHAEAGTARGDGPRGSGAAA